MKKASLLLAMGLLLALGLSACGGAPSSVSAASAPAASASAAQSEASSAKEGGVLVMACEATFPPYEYMSGTEVVGIDVDIAKAIAEEMGMELDIQEMPFDSVIAAVSTGKADFAASGLSVTPERAEQVDFSMEYATSKQVIMTRADSGITSPENLAGTVGVQMGTTGDLELSDTEAYPDVKVERYNKYTDAVNDLISGRLDAIVMDSLPAEQLKSMNDTLVILDDSLLDDSYAIAVKKGNTELLDAIDTVLQKLKDEGKIDEFTLAHLGGDDMAASSAAPASASSAAGADSVAGASSKADASQAA